MNTIDDATLQAYVDGELDAQARARVDVALEADMMLAARLARLHRLRDALRATFDPVLDEPVPPRFQALLAGGTPSGASGQGDGAPSPGRAPAVPEAGTVGVSRGRRRTRASWRAPAWAVAASLMAIAVTLWWRPGDGPVRLDQGRMVAAGDLAEGLERGLASAPEADAAIAIGLSFRATDGRICRSFVMRRGPGLAGLACREAGHWSLPVLSQVALQEDTVRQAASGLPREVQVAVDARLAGEAFDAEQERAARDAGWR